MRLARALATFIADAYVEDHGAALAGRLAIFGDPATGYPLYFTILAGMRPARARPAQRVAHRTRPLGHAAGCGTRTTARMPLTALLLCSDPQRPAAEAAPAGSYTLDMTVPSGYVCSTGPLGTGCGGGCPSQTSVTAPSVGNNFFFTQKRSAW